jgi:sugar fermentation stimulation protein A
VVEAGGRAAVFFVIQMEGARDFRPNDQTDPDFGQALREASRAGVEVLAYDCAVTPESLCIRAPVPVMLMKDGTIATEETVSLSARLFR